MSYSPDGFDLSTWEGQIANIKAVRRRIATGRCVKGGTDPLRPTPNCALEMQDQGESAPVVDECPTDQDGSTDRVNVTEFFTPPSAAVAKMLRPFDFCSFRTAPLDGEQEPGRAPFQAIVRMVGREMDMAPSEMWGRQRGAKHCFARHAIWWLARRWTQLSYPQIARLSVAVRHAPGRDHSTILAGERRFETWLSGSGSYWSLPSYAEWVARRAS